MGSFSVIAVFLLLLLVERGQSTTAPPRLTSTGPVRTSPPLTTTGPVPAPPFLTSTGAVTTPPPLATTGAVTTPPPLATTGPIPTPSQPPDIRVFINLNLKLRAPSTINMYEVDNAIYAGAAQLEQFLQLYYNVKSLRIIDMEAEDASEIYY
nr:classical arabinogalactan protein 4-like [Paramormyrops kingsleyae]